MYILTTIRAATTVVALSMLQACMSSMRPDAITDSHSLSGAQSEFKVYDALLYWGKPDLRGNGLTRIAGTGELWREGRSRESVDIIGLQRALYFRTNQAELFYIDIEHWPVLFVSQKERAESVAKLVEVAKTAKQFVPALRIGFYGLMPSVAYWPLLKHDSQTIQWHEANRELDSLAEHVDVVFPSLYTFYDDPQGWEVYARQTLVEARRYGKPVYAFLWPEYHNSNGKLQGRNIPRDVWRRELELCRELADGIVLWGGWQRSWNPRAEWWLETEAFLSTLKN